MVLILFGIALTINCSKDNNPDESSSPWGSSPEIKTQTQKNSYAMGYNLGTNVTQIYQEVDDKSLIQGVFDAVNQNDTLMTEEEMKNSLGELQKNLAQKQSPQQLELGKKNQEEGEKYLEQNSKREGVKTTSSGLQYEILKEGTGPSPQSSDRVEVNYRGTLIDGTEFDSSFKRGKSATFALNRVIPGWQEVLQLMKKGAKYRVIVPPHLAYRDRQVSPEIGPNSTLVFEIELLDVISADVKADK